MVYDLPVEEEKVKPHQITTLHLVCALAFIVTGAIIFRYNFIITAYGLTLLIIGLLLAIATIAKNGWVTGAKMNPVIRSVELVIAIWVAAYSVMQQWKFPSGIFGVLSAALLFALYYERDADSKLVIHIDDAGVKLPASARKRFIQWTEIEQVVFRFGTVSIDCVDNRLFQWNIENPGIDIDAFEAYCKGKVDEHRDKRRNDEW
ncbi:MAG: hypothetical protein JWQ38_2906 [Flavipsychrobacter sp.]|nr:hypothetical protein [Flavipsychrobacter sp.]